MLALYVIAAVIGGGLVLLSALGGGDHEHGHDHDVHADSDASGDHDFDGPWIPFLSLRFWTYFATAFGITGLLLKLWLRTPDAMTLAVAAGTGLVTGLLVAMALRMLRRAEVDSSVRPSDLLGLEVQVIVAVRPGQPGRVRVRTKGEILDLLAVTDDEQPIESGSTAVIVDLDGDRVKVMSRENVFGHAASLEQPISGADA